MSEDPTPIQIEARAFTIAAAKDGSHTLFALDEEALAAAIRSPITPQQTEAFPCVHIADVAALLSLHVVVNAAVDRLPPEVLESLVKVKRKPGNPFGDRLN